MDSPLQKRLVKDYSYPGGSDVVECCLGEFPLYFSKYSGKEVAGYPVSKMHSFCSYLKGKNGEIIQPIVFVNEDMLPEEFADTPEMFFHIAAFYAHTRAATGSKLKAMFSTLRQIKNDSKAFERYSGYCMRAGDNAPLLQRYLKDKQDIDSLLDKGKLRKDQYDWLLKELEEECSQPE